MLIALVIVLAALALAVVFRVFAMAPAYVYQRSIYYVFKYNPLLVTQGLALSMNTAVYSFAVNFSRYMVNYGVTMYLHVLAGWTPLPTSLLSMLQQEFNLIINTAYAPTGLAVPVGQPVFNVSVFTDFYGALGVPNVNMIYSGGSGAGISIGVSQKFNMPTLGIYNLTLSDAFNYTAIFVHPGNSTCNVPTRAITYTAVYSCTFNFTSPQYYRCINPGVNETGLTYSIWAGIQSPQGIQEGALLLYPIDELDSSGGFRVSALFKVTNINDLSIGLSILDPYPSTPQGYAGYTIIVQSSSNNLMYTIYAGTNQVSQGTAPLSVLSGNVINVTIQVTGITGGPFSSNPTATATFYINGSSAASFSVSLPKWNYIYSQEFSSYMYELAGVDNAQGTYAPIGSWVTILNSSGANIFMVQVRLKQNYRLVVNPLILVSLNNAPALGTTLNLAYVKPTVGLRYLNISYVICNITSSGVIYEVNLSSINPQLIGYPYNQLLILTNYSGIVLALNPWSPGALATYGVDYSDYIPYSKYSSTSMVGYYIQVYNTASNSLINLVYLWNGGVPTALTIYQGESILVYYGSLTTIYLVNVKASSVNIYPGLVGSLKLYTFKETILNIPPGYMVLNETAPSASLNPGMVIAFQYLPSETLPITYVNSTITNCYSFEYNQLVNYALLLNYVPGQGYVYYGYGGGSEC